MLPTKKTALVYSELFMWHDTQRFNMLTEPGLSVQPGKHVENEETKRRMRNLIAVSQLEDSLVHLKPGPANRDALLRFHSAAHVDRIEALCLTGGGIAGNKTPVGRASFDIAMLAVGGVLDAIDGVVSGEFDNAYVLCRPPGHHADRETAHGFCLFANGVLGVLHAQQVHGIRRIAVVDWDVHHGNGAETAFYDNADVLTVSLHQDNLFPTDRGKVEEIGNDGGVGANLNIPLPPGSGSGAYRAAFEELVLPKLEAFQPEMILVASGFDAAAMDPLGHMMLSSSDYRYMTRRLMDVADRHSGGRIVMTHEGGYSEGYVPYCGLAVMEAMSGQDSGLQDPFESHILMYGGQAITAHQKDLIQQVKGHHSDLAELV
ncbi:class II histone deacetylase [Lutimaribacter sp. EGI FJ00015]|uniref:Class II histone deacetylase n=1 Tax=Lutimaribacter degradans TaxID=2945989 RepID=A0ACC5ZUI4_9RHOB|nr:class II histone deacetylase [Lutimaribacter sp. EGI FJ00013]MCM2561706.1 class II histone deacetylase [Lutimaribacter sp. EGI FJ00013]MCO0612581.1 class II histone deacetylase [Lutimaribacter sp. EGI FJ00015]MCO0635240.1 class II histone deacetylase [Lutimaribacter sp. EGI FJ00014]